MDSLDALVLAALPLAERQVRAGVPPRQAARDAAGAIIDSRGLGYLIRDPAGQTISLPGTDPYARTGVPPQYAAKAPVSQPVVKATPTPGQIHILPYPGPTTPVKVIMPVKTPTAPSAASSVPAEAPEPTLPSSGITPIASSAAPAAAPAAATPSAAGASLAALALGALLLLGGKKR